MDYADSKRCIVAALDGRPVAWLAKKLGYRSDDYVNKMLSGTEPSPADLYDDIAKILRVRPRTITPSPRVVTFARPGGRGQRAVASG